MNRIKLAIFAAVSIAMPTLAHSASTNIDAVCTFTNGVQVGNEQNMDFGTIDYSAPPGAGDTVSLGTDGSVAYAGVFNGAAVATPGGVDVTTGSNTFTVEVFCDQTATMTDGAGASIDVTGVEVDPENATSTYGAGSPCNGVGGAAASSLVLNIGTLDTFNFGGRIDGATAVGFAAGSYSTGFVGGDDIQVDMFYQ